MLVVAVQIHISKRKKVIFLALYFYFTDYGCLFLMLYEDIMQE